MTTPTVLVGISTYNRADILPKAVESALAQSHRRVKVAVLDDASTDATPALAGRFPQVQWIRWDTNRGYVPARNHLMLSSKDDYYVSLDDDAWFLAGDEIALALQVLEQNPEIAAVAFDILSPDRPGTEPRRPFVRTALFIGCGHVLRLDAVRRLNGYASFPESYGGEEKDLCLRLLDAGLSIVKLPGVHVWHDKTATARDVQAQLRSGVCNDLTLTLRRTPLWILPVAMAWKFFRHLQFGMKARCLAPCLEGMRIFLCAVPAIWRGRQPVKLSTLRRFGQLVLGESGR